MESPARPPEHPSCLVFARAEDAKLKGLPVAAKAMAELNKVPRHARTRLTILGAQPGTDAKLWSDLRESAGARLNLRIKPYSSDRAVVSREIRSASLVLMPSLEEGFGLTGLEAISEGAPVLLSSASGLAQALQKYVPDHATHHVLNVEATPAEIGRRMQELLDQPELAFDRVEVLREAMKERFSWRRSVEELIAALRAELRAPRRSAEAPSSRRPPLAERLRDSLKQASLGLQGWKQTLAQTGDWLERPELEQLRVHCRTAELPCKPVVLLGAPGSGKSALLSRLVQALQAHDVAVLALKADELPASIDSPIALEGWLRLAAPVAQALDAVARLQRTVLVIDQLDALADLVDLKSERLNVLLTLVSEVTRRARVPVVLSCRSFELEHDARLRALDCEKLQLKDLAIDDVQRAVAKHAPQVHLTARLTELLRLPHMLNLYLSLPPDRRADTAVESHQGLVRARWQQLVGGHDEEEVAQQVAILIAKREELWLSTDLPDLRALQARVQALLVSGLLVQQPIRGIEHIAFAHQTLFEFARARSFLGHATLPQVVRVGQDGLFVRPVLWVTLPYLRAADFPGYLRQLHKLWRDTSVRRHVQALLLEFLSQLSDPEEQEITLVVERLTDPRWQIAALRALTGQRRWFELLADSCMPGVMAGAAGELAIGVLLRATEFAPQQVAALMERVWWPKNREWIERVVRFASVWSPELLALARRLVTAGATEVRILLSKAVDVAPDVAPELIRIELDRQLQLIRMQPEGTRKEAIIKLVERPENLWSHTLQMAAEKLPRPFAEQLFPWLASAMEEFGVLKGFYDSPRGKDVLDDLT
ncbi:MAG: glycosyltransferase [Myxococcales bacterium]|nr:glycosyltransferase [Myxococcales bacterium]